MPGGTKDAARSPAVDDAAEPLGFPELVDEVLRLSGRLATVSAERATAVGLTASQHLVLTAVVNASRPPTVPRIGRSLGHSRQAVQRTADALAQLAMIEYADNPDHKTARLLLATERGRAAHAAVHALSRSWIAEVTDGIEPRDLARAASTLRAIRHRVERPGPEHR